MDSCEDAGHQSKKKQDSEQDSAKNLKMITLTSYDLLVRQLDIYTEEILAKLNESECLDNYEPSQITEKIGYNFDNDSIKSIKFNQLEENDEYIDPYKEKYEIDVRFKVSKVDPNKITVHDYVNKMRQEMIDELEKVQGEILKMIEKRNNEPEDSTGDKECFLLITKNVKNNEKSSRFFPFRIYLFVLDDFKMDSKVKLYFKSLINEYNASYFLFEPIYLNNEMSYGKLSLEKEAILACMISNYVIQLLKDLAFGHHVFHIKMDQIQKLKKLKLKLNDRSWGDCICKESVLEASDFFTNLKSLSIGLRFLVNGCGYSINKLFGKFYLRNFSGMPSLIYLKIHDIALHSFHGFTNLRKLELSNCSVAHLSSDEMSQSMPNLESIKINYSDSVNSEDKLTNFNFKNFLKLRRLEIVEESDLDFIYTLPPSLSILKMGKQIAFEHPNLNVLDISVAEFDAKVLSDLPSLRHLRIRNCSKINLNYEFLSNIESLSIGRMWQHFKSKIEQIELDFSKLINLKYLELFEKISLKPNSFSELKSLEELRLENLELTNSDLEGVFSNLKQIRVLDLSKNCINNIDMKTFNGLENLNKLDVKGNDLDKVEPKEFLSVFPKLDELILSTGNRSEESKQEFSALFDFQFKKVIFV